MKLFRDKVRNIVIEKLKTLSMEQMNEVLFFVQNINKKNPPKFDSKNKILD